jgi:hypothetical protein
MTNMLAPQQQQGNSHQVRQGSQSPSPRQQTWFSFGLDLFLFGWGIVFSCVGAASGDIGLTIRGLLIILMILSGRNVEQRDFIEYDIKYANDKIFDLQTKLKTLCDVDPEALDLNRRIFEFKAELVVEDEKLRKLKNELEANASNFKMALLCSAICFILMFSYCDPRGEQKNKN